ncbi:glycoside hydrolase family 2 TIM barrel-domain containing protein, partial [Thermoproteota archaeon]
MKKILYFSYIIILAAFSVSFTSPPKVSPSSPKVSVSPSVEINRLGNGHYQLLVDKKPYIIKGVCYNPVPIGQGQDYDFWSDDNQPWIVDGELMKKIGINTVRFYQPGADTESCRKVISDLYTKHGIRTIMGNWLGFWEYPGPFYADKSFRDKVKEDVLNMVKDYKDEPGILFWVLGNENNYSFSGRVNSWSSDEIDALDDPSLQIEARARIYYSFVNELAKEIRAIDPNHPVALGNGELKTLNIANEVCPDIDILACIIYRGKSFGNVFNNLRSVFDRPLVFVEFGCDAYNAYTKQEDQDSQAQFLESQWIQIYSNLANNPDGAGNCLGGTLFEWSDEWWKHNEYDQQARSLHNRESHWSNGAYYFDIKVQGNKNM